tara:strand:+ start:462 stop:3860 length:3399 start_codon:yes stop_codon:yes gene_type:complete
MAETPIDVMKRKIQLTNSVDISGIWNPTGYLVDYSKIKNNFIMDLANRNALNSNPSLRNEDWRKIGNPDGTGLGDVGLMIETRILEAVGGAMKLSASEGNNLKAVKNKLNDRIKEILDNPERGLRDIFKYKSQYVNDNGSKICEGGPTAFFEFLFNFSVPSKVSIRNDILEFPTAGTANGQCFKVYPEGCHYKNTGINIRAQKPAWNPEGDGSRKRMCCYICDIPLFIGSITKARKNMQCEHLFPFVEGILFWVLYSNAIDAVDDNYKDILKTRIQRREYAPVCQDCNCRLKSSIGIVEINPDWLAGDTSQHIVQIIPDSLKKIACFPKPPATGWDKVNHQNKSGLTFNTRRQRLFEVFTPLVKAINYSLKKRNINNARELSQFLIYKYLTYFGDEQINKLKSVLIGGESMKKINEEKKKRNNYLFNMIKNLYNFVNIISKKEAKSSENQNKLERERERAQQAKDSRPPGARGESGRIENLKQAKQRVADARNLAFRLLDAKKNVNNKIRDILRTYFDKHSTDIKSILSTIKTDIKNNSSVDYSALYNIDQTKITKIENDTDEIDNIIRATEVSRGGGKIFKIQKGGNFFETLEEKKMKDNAYFIYLLAQNELLKIKTGQPADLDFVLAAIKGIDNKISINNKISHNEIINKNKEIIEELGNKKWNERNTCEDNVCDFEQCPEDECPSEVPSILSFLNSIDPFLKEDGEGENEYFQLNGGEWAREASQDEYAPIIDRKTYKMRESAQAIQSYILTTITGKSQRLMDNYLIKPSQPNLPEVFYRSDIWGELSEKRCFICAKQKNTPGWSLQGSGGVLSNSSVPWNSSKLYTVVMLNKTQQYNDVEIGGIPFCFCPTHWRDPMIRRGVFKDNLNAYTEKNLNNYLTEMARRHHLKVEALERWKIEQEQLAKVESRKGYERLFSPITVPADEEPDLSALNLNAYTEDNDIETGGLSKTDDDIEMGGSSNESDIEMNDVVAAAQIPVRTWSDNDLRQAVFERVILYIDNAIFRGVWWTVAGKVKRAVPVTLPVEPKLNETKMNNLMKAYRGTTGINMSQSLDKAADNIFKFWKDAFNNSNWFNPYFQLWNNVMSGGKRRKKTKRRRRKKKRTKRRKKQKKKTKRRRKKRKQTRRKR